MSWELWTGQGSGWGAVPHCDFSPCHSGAARPHPAHVVPPPPGFSLPAWGAVLGMVGAAPTAHCLLCKESQSIMLIHRGTSAQLCRQRKCACQTRRVD